MAKLNIHDDINILKSDRPLNLPEFGMITIPLWMRTKLDLKQNELLLCGLIFSFSQDGSSEFYGSRQYLCDVLGCSINTIDNLLKKLVEKGIINKRVENINGVKFPRYSFNFDCLLENVENSIPQNLGLDTQNVTTIYSNNINNNIYNNIVPKNCGGVSNNDKSSKALFNELKSKTNSKYTTKNVIDEMFSHYEKLYNCKYPESNFSKLTLQIQKLQKDYDCTLNELSTKIIAWMDFWKSSDWQREEGNFVLPSAVWIRNKLDGKISKNGNTKNTPPAYYEGQKVNTYDSNNNRRK